MWDLIHDRTHMRGDLPFDPFMIKQRMPFFLYSLEELRCDLTAFRESVRIEKDEDARSGGPQARQAGPVRRDLRPDLPLCHHREPGPQLRRPGRPAAVRLDAPAPGPALDGQQAQHRLGGRGRRRHRPRASDRGALLAFHRPAENGPLARCLRARLGNPHPPPGLRVGQGTGGPAAGRPSARPDGPGAG